MGVGSGASAKGTLQWFVVVRRVSPGRGGFRVALLEEPCGGRKTRALNAE